MLVKVEVYNDGEFWCARGIGEDIFTQGRTVDEVFANIREAVELHFGNGGKTPELDILVLSELKHHAPTSAD
jgi:predicted RNase H-like HicB family nuclease